MKNVCFIILLTSIIFSSCKKFLEIDPETTVSQSSFYKSKSDFEQAVTGIYAPLQAIYNLEWRLTELRSDNTYFFFNVANRGPKPVEDLATFAIETNNGTVLNAWRNNYLIISRANAVLSLIDEATFDQASKDVLKGEALFLRGLAYYELVRKFGGVPFFLAPATSYAETFQKRAEPEVIYDQVISDVTAAAGLLPSKTVQKAVGRATSGAAYALLADVNLSLKKWPEAEAAARKLVGYSLLTSYASIFNPANKNNDELIFQINYVQSTPQPLFSTFPYSFIPLLNDASVITGVGPAIRNGDGGFNIPTPEMLSAYEDTIVDIRYAASIGRFTGTSPLPGVTHINTPYIKKYLWPHNIAGQTNANWPLYRYAEILLILAESLNEQNKSLEALPYLNMVRSRAGLLPSAVTDQAALRPVILHERRIELAFENKWWFDLIRAGTAVSTMQAFGARVKANPQAYYYAAGNFPPSNTFNITENSLLLPIPITEIVIYPELTQNPGYQ